MSVLVTGGAGYIGSHTVVQLVEAGADVVIADNLMNSSREVLSRLQEITGKRVEFAEIDVADSGAVAEVIDICRVDEVIHFAGRKAVWESVLDPLGYYAHNLESTISLLQAMRVKGVYRFAFSSSATVYGAAAVSPVDEGMPTSASNPYGWTKVMLEQVLRDLARSDPTWRMAILRYFNPVGAHESGRLGEDPRAEPSNLLPLVAQVAVGRRNRLKIFGDDYATPDGSGVRDFIHVQDLAAGHICALRYLRSTANPLSAFNLGTGRGTSVKELVAAFERASGRKVAVEIAARRPGDVAASYADASLAERLLGWKAERTIDDICQDTWRWQSLNPDGYDPSG